MDTQEKKFLHILGVPVATQLDSYVLAVVRCPDLLQDSTGQTPWTSGSPSGKGLQHSTLVAHGTGGLGTVHMPTVGFLLTLWLLPREPPRFLLSLCPPRCQAQQKPITPEPRLDFRLLVRSLLTSCSSLQWAAPPLPVLEMLVEKCLSSK